MAQYTPNFNLYEPDSSDDFADFRTEFNNNMDIIDQNLGGGGSGGHTIYDKDGNALAQESGLQFTGNVNVSDDSGNGRTVVDILGGGGNVYGAFLDPSRVIYSAFTFDSSTHSWTATEDCILTDNMTPPDGSTAYFIRIDGKQVFAGYNTVEDPFVYVKKGQVVEYRAKSGSTMKAYGITQGTNGIFAPVIYSDNERVIGIWRDNKPLYQKTYSGLSISCANQGVWYSTGQNYGDIENIVFCEIVDQYGQRISGSAGYMSQTPKPIALNLALDNRVVKAFTIQYTKTTDVAGSGNWNTDGVPTHHYSTSEQVIGTWIDGKPLYERTFDFNNQVIPDNTWTNNILGGNLPTIQIKSYDGYFGLENTDWSANFNYIRNNDGGFNEFFTSNSTGSDISVRPNMNAGVNVVLRTCTVRYTKTTD